MSDEQASERTHAATAALKPYVSPALRRDPMKLVTSAELERGYEVFDGDEARPERREYVVLAHVVVDPERASKPRSRFSPPG
jgi:hypothetical protein